MSLWDTIIRDEEEIDLLRDIRTGIANLAAQDGETELTNDTRVGVLHDYVSVPKTGNVLAVPAGTLTIDFETGEATHTALDGVLTDEFESISSLSADAEYLRSLAMGFDTPGAVALDSRDEVPVKPGEYTVNAQRFTEVTYTSKYPAAVVVGASTRAQPHVNAATGIRTSRFGDLAAGTYDSWTAVPVYNPNLARYVEDPYQYADPRFAVDGNEQTTITVVNTGNNPIDAQVLADETDGDDFREIGSPSTDIPAGDHSIFNVSESHRLLRTDVQNSTDGQTVAATVKVHGR